MAGSPETLLPAGRPPAGARRVFELVRELAITDFRLKYNDSALGYAWSMLSPLAMLAIYYFVFRHIIGERAPDYEIYLLVGVVYWAFFQDCTFSGLTSLSMRAGVLRAVHVPVFLVVAASGLSTVITILINTAVLTLALFALGKLSPLFPLVLLPIACLVMFAMGVSLLASLLWVRFRDIGLFWNLVLQAWFWMTPVVYTIRNPDFEELLYLNPVARCLYLIRWFMVYHYLPSFRFVAITVVACAGFFLFALQAFRQREPRIPEEL
jgi:ABC-type polysaccharide/polyol phosphate export permease